jgi:hypothetical protein
MTDLIDELHRAGEHVAASTSRIEVPEIVARVRTRRRRRSLIAASATVALVIAVVALAGTSPNRRAVRVQTPVSSIPERIAAVTDDDRLVVLDARTGTRLRELATGVTSSFGTPRIAVSPDGHTIYFQRTRPARPGECSNGVQTVHEIARVDTNGGTSTPIVTGSDPAMSRDGMVLAYGTRTDDQCGRPNAVGLLPLADIGTTARLGRPIPARDPARTAVDWLAWAPDSHHLLVGMVEPDTSSYPRIIDTTALRSNMHAVLEDGSRINISDATQAILVYRGTHGDLLGWSDQPPNGPSTPNATWAVAVDASTGQVTERLFHAPNGIIDPPEPDATGDHIVAIIAPDTLYRWSTGDRNPTRITSGLIAAVWIPVSDSSVAPSVLSPRQRATVCTAEDLGGLSGPLSPAPPVHRLAQPVAAWFGHVHLDPPPNSAQPSIAFDQAWNGIGFIGERDPSAIYEVILADWTSDDFIVMKPHGQPVSHQHVLAWVAIGKHVPVAASDVSASDTVPGVPCYFGTSITAVDATTGEAIADAYDYHR